jgi:hypothetical protein
LLSIRYEFLACGFHALDAVFRSLVLSFDKLSEWNFTCVVGRECLLEV